jgi:hypothetical protein
MVKKTCWKKGSLSNATSKGAFKRAASDPSLWSSDMKGAKRGRFKGTKAPVKEDTGKEELDANDGDSASESEPDDDHQRDGKKQRSSTENEGDEVPNEGGWTKPVKERERGSLGVGGEEATYPCKLCLKQLAPEFFNAKRLNGVRRGWVQPEELACKECNLSLANHLAPSLKAGGPLARAKKVEKSEKKLIGVEHSAAVSTAAAADATRSSSFALLQDEA